MKKGLDFLEQIKYEIEHNAEFHTQSVKIPIKDLNALIELVESNQYRLDLATVQQIQEMQAQISDLTSQNRKLSKLTKVTFNDTHEGERDVL